MQWELMQILVHTPGVQLMLWSPSLLPTLHPFSLPITLCRYEVLQVTLLLWVSRRFSNLLYLRILLALTFKMSIYLASYGNLISETTRHWAWNKGIELEIWIPTSALPLHSNGNLIEEAFPLWAALAPTCSHAEVRLCCSQQSGTALVSGRTLESQVLSLSVGQSYFFDICRDCYIFVIFDIRYKIPWCLIFPAYLWVFLFSHGLNMFSVSLSVLQLWKPCVSFRKMPASSPTYSQEKLRCFNVFLVYGSVFWRDLVMN